jgi:chemotaxis signal transduction protein
MLADLPPADTEESMRILRRRAALLARPAHEPIAADTVPVLEFVAAGEPLAIELSCVREVRGFSRLVPLPRAERSVLGVTQLAGRMLPVIDLAADLGLTPNTGPLR